jgi:Flp pilus assembly protein CpaB
MELLRRRPPRAAVVSAGLAVACAVAAVAVVTVWAREIEASRPDLGPPAQVVVANADLVRGTELAARSLTVETMPSSLVPPGSLTAVEQAVGRVMVADLAAGEVVTRTRVASRGAGPIAALVPPGLRGIVVASGVPSGVLRPGDLVDVIATYGSSGGRPYTDTVATALSVVRVLPEEQGFGAETPGRSGASIVLLADPATAEGLARASALGLITVAIAGPQAGSPTTLG